MIEASHLVKKYGEKTALDDVSFRIETGEIVGFLGPNGAGKSTTMNLMAGYRRPTEGSVSINGADICENPLEAKKHISYLPEIPPLYLDMTVEEQLAFACELRKLPLKGKTLSDYVEGLCARTSVLDVKSRLIRNLSKGYRQRVAVTQMLVGEPEILILDEPTVGLDPRQIHEFRDLIVDLNREHTIVLSSHILPEISSVCRRVLVFDEGKLIADGEAARLGEQLTGKKSMEITVAGEPQKVELLLRSIPAIRSFERQPDGEAGCVSYRLDVDIDSDVRRDLFHVLSRNEMPLLLMKPVEFSLESLYLQLTAADGTSNRDEEAAS